MNNIRIRPITLQDLPAVMALQRQCFDPMQWVDEVVYKQRILHNMVSNLLLLVDNCPAGCAFVEILPTTAENYRQFKHPQTQNEIVYVCSFAITPTLHNQGLGHQLLTAVLNTAKGYWPTADQALIMVNEDNYYAHKLYTSLGFTFQQITEKFGSNKIIMYKNLDNYQIL